MITQRTLKSNIIIKIAAETTTMNFKKYYCKAALAAEKAINNIKPIKVDGMTVHVRAHIGNPK